MINAFKRFAVASIPPLAALLVLFGMFRAHQSYNRSRLIEASYRDLLEAITGTNSFSFISVVTATSNRLLHITVDDHLISVVDMDSTVVVLSLAPYRKSFSEDGQRVEFSFSKTNVILERISPYSEFVRKSTELK